MVNIFYDSYQVLTKVYKEGAFLKQAINSTFIEEKNRKVVTKAVYGVLDKDIELSFYLEKLTTKKPKQSIQILIKIGMYFLKYLNKHDYAVIDNIVKLTKKLGKSGASGFVNATLRNFTKSTFELPNNQIEKLSIKYSYPKFIVSLLIDDYGLEKAEAIMSSKNEYTSILFNDEINGEEYLTKNNIDFTKTPFKNAFLVKNFTRNADYDNGLYTFQSIGSIQICDIVDSGDYLLDCCAAPGGKTINLSKKFNKVLAFDLHEHRCNLITQYANRMKVKNVQVENFDMKIENTNLYNTFDAVLVDAPCSGVGVLNENPDIKLNRSYDDILELNKTQLKILSNASKYVKVNGYLYYSTCSVLYKENTDILEKFMSGTNNFIVENITAKIPHIKLDKGITLTPDISFGQGFFFSKLKRIK